MDSFAAPQAKGKAAKDNIFAANAAAVAAAAKYGDDKVTNGTIGAIMDDEGKLVCLPTVEKVYRNLPTTELIAYAPISGLPEYLDKVLVAAFGDSRPNGYIGAVATAGGTGAGACRRRVLPPLLPGRRHAAPHAAGPTRRRGSARRRHADPASPHPAGFPR